MSKFTRYRFAGLLVLSAAGLTACQGDNATMATDSPRTPVSFFIGDATDDVPALSKIKVCVTATSNVGGTFVFTRTAVGGSVGTALTDAVVAPGSCVVVAEDVGGPGVFSNVSITQTSAGLVTVSALEIRDPGTGPVVTTSPFNNGDSRSVNGAHGFVITFDNFVTPPPPPPPPAGNNGCSPGYWKNHAFPAAYSASATFNNVFGNAVYGTTKTLLQVLNTGGGGLAALGRQTVSALLNAQVYTEFGYTTTGVIAAFNAAVPGTAAAQTDLKNVFEALTDVNGRICTNPTGK